MHRTVVTICTVQWYLYASYLVPLRPKYSPQHPILKHVQLTLRPQYERPIKFPISFVNYRKCKKQEPYCYYSPTRFASLQYNKIRRMVIFPNIMKGRVLRRTAKWLENGGRWLIIHVVNSRFVGTTSCSLKNDNEIGLHGRSKSQRSGLLYCSISRCLVQQPNSSNAFTSCQTTILFTAVRRSVEFPSLNLISFHQLLPQIPSCLHKDLPELTAERRPRDISFFVAQYIKRDHKVSWRQWSLLRLQSEGGYLRITFPFWKIYLLRAACKPCELRKMSLLPSSVRSHWPDPRHVWTDT